MPSGEELLTYSIAVTDGALDFDLPPRMTQAMLFTPDIDRLTTPAERKNIPNIEVGAQCTICPRKSCPARRDQFILT